MQIQSITECNVDKANKETPPQSVFVETNEEQETDLDQASVVVSTVPLQNSFAILQDEPEENRENKSQQQKQEQEQQNQKPETTPNYKQRRMPDMSTNETEANTVILCDSNGKYLNLKKLCPRRKVAYFRCPTIKRGEEIIESSHFNAPQTILIHTGTNDLERDISTSQLTSEVANLITATAEKYPTSKVLYSTLLPRQDLPNEEVSKISILIEKKCSRLANVHFIDHTNLFQQDVLHDLKHLNQYGVKLFAKNLKSMIYGRRQIAQHQSTNRGKNSTQVPNKDGNYTAVRQEHEKSNPSYAAVLQRNPPRIIRPTPPPLPTIATMATPEIQGQMEQQGQIMNISIPKKMFPIVQFFNSLI